MYIEGKIEKKIEKKKEEKKVCVKKRDLECFFLTDSNISIILDKGVSKQFFSFLPLLFIKKKNGRPHLHHKFQIQRHY